MATNLFKANTIAVIENVTGGGCADEEISIVDCNGTRYEEVEDAIMGTLFGREDLGIKPLIKPF